MGIRIAITVLLQLHFLLLAGLGPAASSDMEDDMPVSATEIKWQEDHHRCRRVR